MLKSIQYTILPVCKNLDSPCIYPNLDKPEPKRKLI